MEEVNVDRKSFYKFLELLFNKIDPVNRVTFKTDNKKGYKKIDNDYYKCFIDEYSLVYPNGEKILSHNLISKAIKLWGNDVIVDQKEFDTSVITLGQMREIFYRDYEKIPMLSRMPEVIQSIKVKENFDESGVLVIDDDLKEVLSDTIVDYLKEEDMAFSNLQIDLFYKSEEKQRKRQI